MSALVHLPTHRRRRRNFKWVIAVIQLEVMAVLEDLFNYGLTILVTMAPPITEPNVITKIPLVGTVSMQMLDIFHLNKKVFSLFVICRKWHCSTKRSYVLIELLQSWALYSIYTQLVRVCLKLLKKVAKKKTHKTSVFQLAWYMLT